MITAYPVEAWLPQCTPTLGSSFISLDAVLPEDLSVNHKNINCNPKQLYTQANLVFADAAFTEVPLEATFLPQKRDLLISR